MQAVLRVAAQNIWAPHNPSNSSNRPHVGWLEVLEEVVEPPVRPPWRAPQWRMPPG